MARQPCDVGGRETKVIGSEQPRFTEVEYGNRRRVSRREKLLTTMDATIPWTAWIELMEPHSRADGPGKRGRKPKPADTMLLMHLTRSPPPLCTLSTHTLALERAKGLAKVKLPHKTLHTPSG